MWQVIGAIVNAVKGQKAAQQEQDVPREGSQAPPPAAASSKIGGVISSIAGGGGEAGMGGEVGGEAGLSAMGDTGTLPAAAVSAPVGASGVFELEGAGGLPQDASAVGGSIDVMGGADIGEKARASAAKESPAVQDYLKNAMKEYVRRKMAKKFGGMAGIAAAAGGTDENGAQSELGKKIGALSDWMNETPSEQRNRRKGQRVQQ